MLLSEVSIESAEYLLDDIARKHQLLLPNELASRFTIAELVNFYRIGLASKSWRMYVALNDKHQVIGCIAISISRLPILRSNLIRVLWGARENILYNLRFLLERTWHLYNLYPRRNIRKRILFIFVSQDNQRMGIGKALLFKISSENATDVYVDTKDENVAALTMYQEANFVVAKRRFGQTLLVLKV